MKTILIVDDSAFEQEEFRDVLTGYEVLEATTAAQARRYFASRKKDIAAIIFDGHLSPNDSVKHTLKMIADFKKEGFAGPMFAASSDGAMRVKQVLAGCQFSLLKFDKRYVPQIIEQSLAEMAEGQKSGT